MPDPLPVPAEPSALDILINPEVFQDEFYQAIVNLARSAPLDTVLEIGSSSGGGSTQAWVEGLRQNPRRPKLYCMEVSRARCAALKERWENEGFVECFLGSSVRPDQFPSAAEVEEFYNSVPGPLRKYPLEEVLGWLKADLDYIEKEKVPAGCIAEIKRSRGIRHFSAVLIDGSEFTGDAELDEVYGAEFILLDDTQTYKCHAARRRLLHDPGYELIADNPDLRHGYSIFRRRRRTRLDPLPGDAPVHFFTIVLNGEPFIRHHIEVLRRLSFRWRWHIVEGAAELKHDTAWSVAAGGALPEDQHANGLSTDGTTAYLDELSAAFPDQVRVYRPPAGRRWDGKTEMVAEPLRHIFEDGVLWQIDSDELWTAEQLETGRRMFLESPEKAAAWFWCDYFVGENLVVATRNGYAQNPKQEWLRAWSFRPGMKWLTHEPPVLAERRNDGSWKNLADGPVFTHRETEAAGLVFQHFAYVTEEQLRFKERYYGYAGALESWRSLQAKKDFPLPLREFFPWVTDETLIDTALSRGVEPLARRNPETGAWRFSVSAARMERTAPPAIVVDGIFFELGNTGIGRVWLEIFKLWSASPVAERIWILDRNGTAPRLPGLRYRRVPGLNAARLGEDSRMLQAVCDELNAGVFISTYYSAPLSTPSVSMIYDMIPELLGIRDGDWQWTRKTLDILRSERFVCISESTARDLQKLHPEIEAGRVSVLPLAPPPEFRPSSAEAVADFRERHGLQKDYLLIAGERVGIHVNTQGYKNAALAFKAWSLLPEEERESLAIVCAGGKPELEEELRALAPDATVRIIRFTDADLPLAYAGAVALAYPSLYEGFGLPVIEAMACGCPVVTCRRSSLTEVAGDAAVFVDPWDAEECAAAIRLLRNDSTTRARHVSLGMARAARFSYQPTAAELARLLLEAADRPAVPVPSAKSRMFDFLAQLQTENADAVSAVKNQPSTDKNALKDAKKKIQSLRGKIQKLESRLTRAKRRPLRRLWDFVRGKKHS